MRNEMINGQVTSQVLIHQLGDVGSALVATKGGTFPDATRYKLERTRPKLVSRGSDSNHARGAPSTMRTLKRSSHHFHVARAVKRVIDTPLSQVTGNVLLDWFIECGAIDAIGSPKRNRRRELGRVDIHSNDATRSCHFCALNDCESL